MKYSIVIPTRNRVEYLRYAIASVLNQNYFDFELIVSNNHSTDDTAEYLEKIKNPNLRILKPTAPLSMSKHFEFAIKHAQGDWISLLGDDDGLQPYFFQLMDLLTQNYKGFEIYNGKRAYYFWKGSSQFFNNRVVTFEASPSFKRIKSKHMMCRLLYTDITYFDAPQFYTGTVFSRSYIEKLIKKQHGTIFTSLTPDANSAAMILRTTAEYLFSEIPLTWIGTSTKSNGYNQFNIKELHGKNSIVEDFNALNDKDQMTPLSFFSNFLIVPDIKCYFLEALFQSDQHYAFSYQSILKNALKRHLIFTSVFTLSKNNIKMEKDFKAVYDQIFTQLNINKHYLKFLTFSFYPLVQLKTLIFKTFDFVKYMTLPFISKKYIRIRSEDYIKYPTILEASLRSRKYFDDAAIEKAIQ